MKKVTIIMESPKALDSRTMKANKKMLSDARIALKAERAAAEEIGRKDVDYISELHLLLPEAF